MSILASLRNRGTVSDAQPEPEVVDQRDTPLMRFLTVGGAAVDLVSYHFKTRYTTQGRPFVYTDTYREVDGFRWFCAGCGESGPPRRGGYDIGYLPDERGEARRHANEHATTCRAMPRPEASR